MGARGKQAQLAQANGSKFNLLLMLVAQMSTYPRAIATHYCSWGSRNFKLIHGALTAFEDLGVQPRRPCSPWTLRVTTFVVVISSWDLMVTSTGSRARIFRGFWLVLAVISVKLCALQIGSGDELLVAWHRLSNGPW